MKSSGNSYSIYC